MQSLWMVLVVLLLIFFIVPIFFKVYLTYDIFLNLGVVSLYIFCFKIFAYKIRYKKNKFVFYAKKDKRDVEINLTEKQLRLLNKFTFNLKEKIIIKSITFNSKIGFKNAMDTAIINGFVNSIITIVYSLIKSKKKSLKLYRNINPAYNQDNFTIAIQMPCFLTLFDIIYSFVISFLSLKREMRKIKNV